MIQLSYAVIDHSSESGLYEVQYGEPVSAGKARAWLLKPPMAIRKSLKPGMLLLARDAPYSVSGFAVVDEHRLLISRIDDQWLDDGQPPKSARELELKLVGVQPKFAPNRYYAADGSLSPSDMWLSIDRGKNGQPDRSVIDDIAKVYLQKNKKLRVRVVLAVCEIAIQSWSVKNINLCLGGTADKFSKKWIDQANDMSSAIVAIRRYLNGELPGESLMDISAAHSASYGNKLAMLFVHGIKWALAYRGYHSYEDFAYRASVDTLALSDANISTVLHQAAKRAIGLNNYIFAAVLRNMLNASF